MTTVAVVVVAFADQHGEFRAHRGIALGNQFVRRRDSQDRVILAEQGQP